MVPQRRRPWWKLTVPWSLMALAVASSVAPLPAHSWRIVGSPNEPGGGLFGVSCTSVSFCVAVGQSSRESPLIEAWRGHNWQLEVTPKLKSAASSLDGVDCLTRKSCWAIGAAQENLFERWNGSQWQILPSPPGSWDFGGISCPAITTCVVVGTNGNVAALAIRFDGHWVTTKGASPRADLSAVSCVSSKSCEVVGAIKLHGSELTSPYAEVWNGTRWLNSDPIAVSGSYFSGVSCWSATGCLAVGTTGKPDGGSSALVEMLVGRHWVELRTDEPDRSVLLNSVSCTRSNLCLVGGSENGEPLLLAWSGTAMQRVVTPAIRSNGVLNAIAMSPGLAVAVGEATSSRTFSRPLLEMS
jgi:hypothetical protein